MDKKKGIVFDEIFEKLTKCTDDNKFFLIYKTYISSDNITNSQLDSIFDLAKSKIEEWPLFLVRLYGNLSKNPEYVLHFVNNEVNEALKSLVISDEKKRELLGYQYEDDALDSIEFIDIKLGDSFYENKRDKAIIIYLWFMTNNNLYKSKTTSARAKIFEKAFVRYFSTINEVNYNVYQCSLLVKSLEQKHFEIALNKFYYLYADQENENKLMKNEILELKNKNEELLKFASRKTADIVQLNEQILEDKQKIQESLNCIDQLKEEISLLEGKLTFEQNQNDVKLNTLKDDIAEGLQSSIMLEVEGIRDLLEILPDRARIKIERRLDRVEKRLNRG